MNGLFLVESPFQLLCAYEAISAYPLKKYTVVVRFSRKKKNDEQLKKMIATLFAQDASLYTVTIGAENRNVKDILQLVLLSLFVAACTWINQYIFIGNADSGVLGVATGVVKKSKIILLDDGIKSLFTQEKSSQTENYSLFTMLNKITPFQGQSVKFNRFSRLRGEVLKDKAIDDDQVLFLGTDIYEYGLINEDQYIAYVTSVVRRCGAKKFIYVPHRLECDNKLVKLTKLPGLNLKRIDYPVELYSLYNNNVPKNIYSFYSGALVSLKCIYGASVNVYGLKFDYSKIKNKNEIDRIYKQINQYINVEEVTLASPSDNNFYSNI